MILHFFQFVKARWVGEGLARNQKNRGESAPTVRLKLTPKRAVFAPETARGVPHSPSEWAHWAGVAAIIRKTRCKKP